MSKTILTELDGFTPVIDCLVKEYGLVTAAVFGRIWRYCQMETGVCQASLDTMAEYIGLDKATIMRHAKKLVDAGYLKDLSPDLRNHPHTYADTGKVTLTSKISVAQNNAKKERVADDNASVAQSNASVAENQLKIDIKKDSKIQREEQKERIKESVASKGGIDWLVRSGAPAEEVAALNEKIRFAKEATDKFEQELAFNPLPWAENAKWTRFQKFVVEEYRKDPACFRYFSSKRTNEGKFSRLPANPKIYQDPDLLIAIWPSLITVEPEEHHYPTVEELESKGMI